MPNAVMPDQDLELDTRMTLLKTEFSQEWGGRLEAGTVVLVDKKTADRWRRKHIAVDSAETDKTLLEQKQARLLALQAEVESLRTEGTPAIERPSERRVRRG